jgi:hypothetical protein
VLALQYGYFASAAAGLYLVALTRHGPARLSGGAGLLAGAAAYETGLVSPTPKQP